MKRVSLMAAILLMFLFTGSQAYSKGFPEAMCLDDRQPLAGHVYAKENTALGNDRILAEKAMLSPDIEEIIDRGELRVAIPAQDLTAFFQEDGDGNLYGIDIELARGIAHELGGEAVFDRTAQDYEELTAKLKNHQVDMVIATYSPTLERVKYVDFSEPYLELRFGIMVNKQEMVKNAIEGSPIHYLKENRARIAAIKGTSHAELAKQLFEACEIVEIEDYDSAVNAVRDGEVFGFFSGELEFYSRYLAQPELLIYTSTYVFSDVKDTFSIGIPVDKGQLLDYVNLYLRTSQGLTVEDVRERYRAYYTGTSDIEP